MRMRPRTFGVAGGVLLACLVAIAAFAALHWPFRRGRMQPVLEKVLASHIEMRSYRMVFFPHPGFVAQGLTLHRFAASNIPPVGTARRLIVEGRYSDLLLLRNRVQRFDVDQLHVTIPPPGSEANKQDFPPGSAKDFAGGQTTIANFHLQDATLDLVSRSGKLFRYPIRDLRLGNVRRGHTVTFSVVMSNAVPRGEIRASGTFGPLLPNQLGQTAAAGHFTFTNGDFTGIGTLHGTLAGEGQFKGQLSQIVVNGHSEISGFRVGEGNPTDITSQYSTVVDATKGDVAIQNLLVRTDETTLNARGDVAGSPKVTNLDLDVVTGRVQDLMRPFVHGELPVSGPIHLRSHATLLPPPGDFLSRLHMTGTFLIPAGRFTNINTEKSMTDLSVRAEDGRTPEKNAGSPPQQDETPSRLDATVAVQSGFADFRKVTCQVPGVFLDLHGRYDLRDTRAALQGDLRMQKDLSHVTTGWKAVLLKPLAPFFRKKDGGGGTDLPVILTGRDGKYAIHSKMIDPK